MALSRGLLVSVRGWVRPDFPTMYSNFHSPVRFNVALAPYVCFVLRSPQYWTFTGESNLGEACGSEAEGRHERLRWKWERSSRAHLEAIRNGAPRVEAYCHWPLGKLGGWGYVVTW